MKKWTREQMDDFAARWESGETLNAIGLEFGITGQRVRQIISKSRRLAVCDWMLENGWTIERPGGAWVMPKGPIPEYKKPTR